MKVYIAGPMSGLPNYNRTEFNVTEEILKKEGFTVMNPACLPSGFGDHEYMDICMAMIRSCEAIYMLPRWSNSLGAKAEYALAVKLGHLIMGAKE